jgi:hypothetical protein
VQAQLLLAEATEEARSLAAHLSGSDALPTGDDGLSQAAGELMHLVKLVLEFGVKEEWLHVVSPSNTPGALFVARKMATRAPPTALFMIQVLFRPRAIL